jgi:uncharacterized protein YcbK (DUF882 family)
MNLTKNFKLEEFASPDADYFPISAINNLNELAQNIQVLRDYIEGFMVIYPAINVNSGWRTVKHNKAIGGVKNSRHLYGYAADIWVARLSPEDLHEIIEGLITRGLMKQGGLGLYNTFVHYDIYFDGENIRRWDYST